MSFTSVDLPDPETPVTGDHAPEGELDVDVLQVVLPGTLHGEPSPLRLPAARPGTGISAGRSGTAR